MAEEDKDNEPWLNSLFGRSTSSGSEEDEEIQRMIEEDNKAEKEESNGDIEEIKFHNLSRNRRMKIVEKTIGGSIETMLWPAAQYLAEFILDYTHRVTGVATSIVPEETGFGDANEREYVESNSANLDQSMSTQNKKSDYYLKETLHKNAAFEALKRLIFEFDPLIIPPTRPKTGIEDDNCDPYDEIRTKVEDSKTVLKIIELGAGVGLTGIMLASELRCHVLLTDLNEALPLLYKNVQVNKENFIASSDAVSVKALHWGTDEWKSCIRAGDVGIGDSNATVNNNYDATDEVLKDDNNQFAAHQNILLLASDCVYFEELHAPFEKTITSILSAASPGSMCLVAGVRRWKRDNTFFSRIGKITRTKTHHLQCVCIQETVTKTVDNGIDNEMVTKRVVMRVYAIQWVRCT